MITSTTTDIKIEPATKLIGHYTPLPDKSIAHRALILAALAAGRSTIAPISHSADVASTVSCLRQLGVSVEATRDAWTIDSPGVAGWAVPERALDCGNSGTTMRLLAGCLAGRPFNSLLIGDDSLTRRPMARIAIPLRRMGGRITLAPGDTAPIQLQGSHLRGIEYELPIPSAQVKSAILLAGLDVEGTTTVIEMQPSRDHTERMLSHAGVDCCPEAPPRPADRRERLLANPGGIPQTDVETFHRKIVLGPRRVLKPVDWHLPGDFSAAAFFLVAALGMRRADLIVSTVGLNPTRTGLLKILRRMGAEFEQSNESHAAGEPVGQIRVNAAKSLKAVNVGAAEASQIIDELPILAVAAARAEGITVIRGAGELRHKESDRIAAVTQNLRAMGAKVAELEDGWAIEGPTTWQGAMIDPHGDHRIAMAFSIAALWADSPSIIQDAGVVRISDPDFYGVLTALVR